MRTLNSAAIVLVTAVMAAPVFAVGVGGSGSGSGGVNTESIDGGQTNRGASDPTMEEREQLEQEGKEAEKSIKDSDQAGVDSDRERRSGSGSVGGGFSAGEASGSASGSADTEEAEE